MMCWPGFSSNPSPSSQVWSAEWGGICMPDRPPSAIEQSEVSEVATIYQDSVIHNGWGGMCQGASWQDMRGGQCSALDKCAQTVQPIWISFWYSSKVNTLLELHQLWLEPPVGRRGQKKKLSLHLQSQRWYREATVLSSCAMLRNRRRQVSI